MKEYIYLGKVSNTHGIKGEIRIKSDFEKKELVFKKNFKLYFGKNKDCRSINTYRVHKEYDMVTLNGINNINDVIKYKGMSVFIKREDLKLDSTEYIIEDLIGLNIKENEKILGIVEDFMYNNSNVLLCIKADKNFYIPYNDNFIKKVDLVNKTIECENVRDLII
ncbi:MAG: 16S rRNA processing protein RimM [Firmicutes bacterium]|nr:16S rRNA processing protein RimM [Bacillota bacterium]